MEDGSHSFMSFFGICQTHGEESFFTPKKIDFFYFFNAIAVCFRLCSVEPLLKSHLGRSLVTQTH